MGQAGRQTVSEVSQRLQNERWWPRRVGERRVSKGTASEVSESEVAVWLSWAQPFSTYPVCTAFWKLVKKVARGPRMP